MGTGPPFWFCPSVAVTPKPESDGSAKMVSGGEFPLPTAVSGRVGVEGDKQVLD
jgi:hypothetical protein